jgi:membrane protease subunit HflK
VAGEVRAIIQQLVDRYKMGVQVTGVTMQSVQPPEPVQAAFNDAVKAAEDGARARKEGEAYANDILPRARGQAFSQIQDAEAYRSMVVENATGNAARFNEVVTEYAKAPAVTRTRLYLDTMQQIYTSTSKVLLDTKGNNNTVYLPLDKMMAQTQANDAAVGNKSGPVQPPQPQPQPQPQAQQQPQQQAAPQPETVQTIESVRQRDARSRESQRDRETR